MPLPHPPATALLALLLAACGGGGGGPDNSSGGGTVNSDPTTTALAGRVTSTDGSALAGVTVIAWRTNDHTQQSTTTGADGRYAFAGLAVGSIVDYEVRAEMAGWGFVPAPAGSGALTKRSDDFGLLRTVLDVHAPSAAGVSGADFAGYDGRSAPAPLPAAEPSPRFVDNGDGSIADRLTGLVWLKDAGCLGSMAWAGAVAAARALASGRCGLADGSAAGQWRLPNVVELESIVDTSRSNPALPAAHPFANVGAAYWTSTTYYGMPANAWAIRLADGRYLNDETRNVKASANLGAWAVRDGSALGRVKLPASGQFRSWADGDDGALGAGVPLPWPRFVDRGNGSVVDTLTGLTWLKRADCIRQTWDAASVAVGKLASGQCGLADGSAAGDWRMPSRKELLSLADRALGNHAADFATVFTHADGSVTRPAVFGTLVSAQFYWTSSADAADTSMAWTVYSCDFGVYDIAKTELGYTLAVR